MVYLVCYVISAVCFAQSLRYGQQRRPNPVPLGAVNYVVAMLLASIWFVMAQPWHGSAAWFPLLVGVLAGTVYWVHLLVVFASFEIAGVGVTMALVMSSNLIPILVAWAFWNNAVTPPQWVAVALIPLGAWLIRPNQSGPRHLTLKADAILALVFLMGGAVHTFHKSIDQFADPQARPVYNFSLFVAAAVGSVIYAVVRGLRVERPDLAVGAAAGFFNMLNLVLLLLALHALGTAVFFPLATVLVVSGHVLVSWLLWNERITRRQAAGLIVTFAIACLVNVPWGGAGVMETASSRF